MITPLGFKGDCEEVAQHAIGSTEGFTFVLADLKALLKHNVRLNLVQDRHPDGQVQHSAVSTGNEQGR